MNVKLSRALLAAILLSVSMMTSIGVPKAESKSPNYSGVQIISPSDMTYSTRVLTLNATFPCGMGMQYTLKYSLDGGAEKSLPWTVTKANEAHVIHDAFGVLELPPLPMARTAWW